MPSLALHARPSPVKRHRRLRHNVLIPRPTHPQPSHYEQAPPNEPTYSCSRTTRSSEQHPQRSSSSLDPREILKLLHVILNGSTGLSPPIQGAFSSFAKPSRIVTSLAEGAMQSQRNLREGGLSRGLSDEFPSDNRIQAGGHSLCRRVR